ncbi:MAG TPA: hypothetical protein DHV36_05130 [Desulfobacteraceae bacterium]|nr:hypothetical protein [Desulfobacteraceae bacterium]
MDINSVQGLNAYTSTRPTAEDNLVQNQNQEAAQADLNRENAQVVQEAFEVSLSSEGLAQQTTAVEETETAVEVPEEPQEVPIPEPAQAAPANPGEPQQQPSQIINIVA